jgi:hypothetical protein
MRPTPRRGGNRGSALVAVLLVILVLTVVGLGVAYFAQIEDSLTGNARLMRAAFYVAESGLRKGELVLHTVVAQNVAIGSLLTCGTCVTPPLSPPGGGWPAVALMYVDPEDLVIKEFANRVVPVPGNVIDRGRYTLYVRNNVEDPGGQITDTDKVILLISVGQIQGLGGRIYTKILEEQLVTGTFGGEGCGQAGCNSGGTGSVPGG